MVDLQYLLSWRHSWQFSDHQDDFFVPAILYAHEFHQWGREYIPRFFSYSPLSMFPCFMNLLFDRNICFSLSGRQTAYSYDDYQRIYSEKREIYLRTHRHLCTFQKLESQISNNCANESSPLCSDHECNYFNRPFTIFHDFIWTTNKNLRKCVFWKKK